MKKIWMPAILIATLVPLQNSCGRKDDILNARHKSDGSPSDRAITANLINGMTVAGVSSWPELINGDSHAEVYTLHNDSGFVIKRLRVRLPRRSDFTISESNCPRRLKTGYSCTFMVTLIADSSGLKSSYLRIRGTLDGDSFDEQHAFSAQVNDPMPEPEPGPDPGPEPEPGSTSVPSPGRSTVPRSVASFQPIPSVLSDRNTATIARFKSCSTVWSMTA